MFKFKILFIAMLLLVGCGVKGPPLPPMKTPDGTVIGESDKVKDSKTKKSTKKKKRVDAPFQF